MIVSALNYNPFYVEQLKVMLTSLEQNSPNDDIVIYLVDFPTLIVDEFRSVFRGYIFISIDVGLDPLKDDIAGFMVCYRSKIVLECLEKFKTNVAWFDTDLIIRNSLESFWSGVEGNVFRVLVRDCNEDNTKFQAGIFCIGYSDASLNYMRDWNDAVQQKNEWFADQLHLYLQWKKHKLNLKLLPLQKTFNDVGCSKNPCFLENSIIWHCKKKHFMREPFRTEYLNYLNQFEEKNNGKN